MKRVILACGLIAAAAAPSMAQEAYRPAFDPDAMTDMPHGTPNHVMVLGTPHLSQLPKPFQPEMAEVIVDRMVAWAPTAVAVEESAGILCYRMRQMPARYAEAIESYCFDPSMAGSVTGLSVPQANERAEALLADWPAQPSPAQRRELAAVFLAAGEPGSAVVQWLRLPLAEQSADAVLTAPLVEILGKLAGANNETYAIAAKVAAQSGLERLWSVDDQSTYMGPEPDQNAYGAAIMQAWDNPAAKAQAAVNEQLIAGLAAPGGLLALYRGYNAPGHTNATYKADFGAALTEPSDAGFGRRYVAYWETRNLRMVANMREVFGRKPGTRMLAIVGASHKGYYEAYLAQMRDVDLADVTALLNDSAP